MHLDNDAYNEILIQAVLEIRNGRTTVAKQVNNATNPVYWNMGKLLYERLFEEG